jgi:hypothetical protein
MCLTPKQAPKFEMDPRKEVDLFHYNHYKESSFKHLQSHVCQLLTQFSGVRLKVSIHGMSHEAIDVMDEAGSKA